MHLDVCAFFKISFEPTLFESRRNRVWTNSWATQKAAAYKQGIYLKS